jgi:hypothetical protein
MGGVRTAPTIEGMTPLGDVRAIGVRASGFRSCARISLRLRTFCVLVGLAGVLSAGCGGGAGDPAVTGEPISFRELAKAARASADATSGRFAFSMDLSFPGAKEPFAFTGEGAFDTTTGRSSFTLDMSSFASLLGGLFAGATQTGAPDFGDPEGWKIEAIQDGHVMYVRFPAMAEQLPAGKSWVREDLEASARGSGIDFGDLRQFTNNDPRAMLDFLRAMTGKIETVGTQDLRGVATTHYRATIDPLDYEKLAAPGKRGDQFRSLFRDMVAESGIGKMPVDIWVDGFGLVRKLTMAFSATQPGTTESAAASMAFELYDYGKDVAIELPPAAQVVAASALRQ